MTELVAQTEQQIRDKLLENFQPEHLELINESANHAGPASDSHFKLVLVSSSFDTLNRVRRHQAVYRVLAQELAGPVHALALHLYTPAEWSRLDHKVQPSPECAGKNK